MVLWRPMRHEPSKRERIKVMQALPDVPLTFVEIRDRLAAMEPPIKVDPSTLQKLMDGERSPRPRTWVALRALAVKEGVL